MLNNDIDSVKKQIQELLTTLDIPKLRRDDIGWLKRNLFIRNGDNPNCAKVLKLLNDWF